MRNNLLQITVLSVLFIIFSGSQAGHHHQFNDFKPAFPEFPPFLKSDAAWVDSIMEGLTLDDRIAQMIMVYAYSNQGVEHEKAVIRQISRYNIGGILFFQGEPIKQARLTNRFQSASKVPLLSRIKL